MVIIVGSGLGYPSSNPGRGFMHFTLTNIHVKGMNQTILLPAMGK